MDYYIGNTLKFPPVGQCIYCGLLSDGAELTDEHVVPYALNGNMILQKASCKRCAGITSAFEGVVARDQFGVFRAHRNYQTQRRGKRAKATRPITYITEAGERKTKIISLADCPNVYVAPSTILRAALTGAAPSDSNPALNVAVVVDQKDTEPAIATIGEPVSGFVGSLKFAWRPFSLTLAKIAHSYLVAVHSTSGYIAFLPKLIIGAPGTGGFPSYYVAATVQSHQATSRMDVLTAPRAIGTPISAKCANTGALRK